MNQIIPVRLTIFLILFLISGSSLYAAKSMKGYPDGTARFGGIFVGTEDGNIVMKNLGVKTIIKMKDDTPLVGLFRPVKPLIDKSKGVVNFQIICAPKHPQVRKVGKGAQGFRKLPPNYVQGNHIRHHTRIEGWRLEDLEPFGDVLEVIGWKEDDNTIRAHKVYFEPMLDPFIMFDKNIPTMLNIGDSISLGYGRELRVQSEGKFNIDHPRLNCAGITVNSLWFGDYEAPGRHWDVIAFNGGHWNSKVTKEQYMTIFEESVNKTLKGGKKVMWITTAPVPFGYNVGDKGTTNGVAAIFPESQWASIQFADPNIQKENCGRKPGRMMAQNHWVKPILDKYPQVAICDQWGYVYAQSKIEGSPYRKWMYGKNVHFKGDELNKGLAALIVELASVMTGSKELSDVPEEYRSFIHLSSKTYNPIADFDDPTPMDQRYKSAGANNTASAETKGADNSSNEKWWTQAEFKLDATVVNYDQVKGKKEKQRARERIKLAEKDLEQHEAWLKEGEVPAEQVEKAKRVLAQAKKALKK